MYGGVRDFTALVSNVNVHIRKVPSLQPQMSNLVTHTCPLVDRCRAQNGHAIARQRIFFFDRFVCCRGEEATALKVVESF